MIDPVARWAAVAVAMSVHSLAAHPLVAFGTEEQKQRWLPDLGAGRRLAGFGLTEPGAGSDAGATRTRAEGVAVGRTVLASGTAAAARIASKVLRAMAARAAVSRSLSSTSSWTSAADMPSPTNGSVSTG